MKLCHRRNRHRERGQVLVMLALIIVVLLLFAGLAIDSGFGYITRASLSKAVDAASLTGMRNFSQGEATAKTLAQNAFNANYRTSTRDASPATSSMVFSTDASGNKVFNVSGTATINTFFMRLLPNASQLTVNMTAQSTRSKLLMALVLDRSGSMTRNGGQAALPNAVDTFVGYFDNVNDQVAEISFASTATVDVPIGTAFQTPIKNSVASMVFGGGTFGPGGLLLGQSQVNSVVVPSGQNVQKVVIYFTDGWPNIIQQNLACTRNSSVLTLFNFGGYDAGNSLDFFDPTCKDKNNCYPPGGECTTNGGNPSCCSAASGFTSAINGISESFQQQNVTNDALYQAVQAASSMRSQGMTVYAIGLGTSINQAFLQQIANDPAGATYDSSQPAGIAAFAADCPSSACTTELQAVFQTIASQINLRLSQ
jgi:Flp pilus assembly protein TadG